MSVHNFPGSTGLNYRHLSEVWVDTAVELLDPPKGLPLSWWPRFTELTGGLRPGEFTLLCAPTGAGKTQLLANIAAQLFLAGEAQFVAPVETGDVDFVARMLSTIERRDLNTGDPVPEAVLRGISERWSAKLSTSPLYLGTYQDRVDLDEMLAMLSYMKTTYGVKLALLDNLNFFLKVTSAQMERAEMDEAIHRLVIHARDIGMHVILIVHPRKTDGGRVESEFDIKGSSTAVQEAWNVCLYNRPRPEDVESGRRHFTDRELVFRKLRKRGVGVGVPLWFAFEGGRLKEYKS